VVRARLEEGSRHDASVIQMFAPESTTAPSHQHPPTQVDEPIEQYHFVRRLETKVPRVEIATWLSACMHSSTGSSADAARLHRRTGRG
jgi:hypothetical protein